MKPMLGETHEQMVERLALTYGLTPDEVLRQLRFPFALQVTYEDLRNRAQEQRENDLYGKRESA